MNGYPVYLGVLDCEQSRRIAADFEKCGEPHPSYLFFAKRKSKPKEQNQKSFIIKE